MLCTGIARPQHTEPRFLETGLSFCKTGISHGLGADAVGV